MAFVAESNINAEPGLCFMYLSSTNPFVTVLRLMLRSKVASQLKQACFAYLQSSKGAKHHLLLVLNDWMYVCNVIQTQLSQIVVYWQWFGIRKFMCILINDWEKDPMPPAKLTSVKELFLCSKISNQKPRLWYFGCEKHCNVYTEMRCKVCSAHSTSR